MMTFGKEVKQIAINAAQLFWHNRTGLIFSKNNQENSSFFLLIGQQWWHSGIENN
jgi:hypothetical protein